MATLALLGACTHSEQLQPAQEDAAEFELYDNAAQATSYAALLDSAAAHHIILFGELHGNATAHRLQQRLSADLNKRLGAQNHQLMLALEMFEADQQPLLDGLLSGRLTAQQFEEDARLWQNYASDYKPLIDFARAENLPLIASNIPRPFASQVYRNGIESLDELDARDKSHAAPLPIEIDLSLPGYAAMMEMDMGGHGGGTPENLAKAQAVKDATMAHFILTHLRAAENRRVLHFNGRYHSDNYDGIFWYLRHYGFDGEILTITTLSDEEEPDGQADFILMAD
ncbi:MAG: ChaN family lipoprotein [Cyclonatronaceae bacterium]